MDIVFSYKYLQQMYEYIGPRFFYSYLFYFILFLCSVVYPLMGYYQSKILNNRLHSRNGNNHVVSRVSQYTQSIKNSLFAPSIIILFHLLYYNSLDQLGFRLPSHNIFGINKSLFYISIILSIAYFSYNIYAIYSFKKSPQLREESYKSLPYSIKSMLPKTSIEKRFWNYVSLSAAVTEEIIYRGYFFYTIPLMIPSTNIYITLLISSLIFGIGHIYQGKELYKPMLAGLFLGFVYLSTGSLYIVIILHFTQDIVAKYIIETNNSHSIITEESNSEKESNII